MTANSEEEQQPPAAPPTEKEGQEKKQKQGRPNGHAVPAQTNQTSAAASKPRQEVQKPVDSAATPALDDFGLPIRPKPIARRTTLSSDEFQSADEGDDSDDPEEKGTAKKEAEVIASSADSDHHNGVTKPRPSAQVEEPTGEVNAERSQEADEEPSAKKKDESSHQTDASHVTEEAKLAQSKDGQPTRDAESSEVAVDTSSPTQERPKTPVQGHHRQDSRGSAGSPTANRKSRSGSVADRPVEIGGISEWSHQALAPPKEEIEVEEELGWQEMPTDSQMDWYDDYGHMVAKGVKHKEDLDDFDITGKGGAGRGYTRVLLDDDAQSATSMDDHTAYLFKNKGGGTNVVDEEEEEEGRDPLAQMQATKDLLTEGQRIAYVGVTRLSMEEMRKEMDKVEVTKKFRKEFSNAMESMQMWSQKMMVRLYAHMDINSSEQVMIEQLAEHGIQPADMSQALMQNARVKNPVKNTEAPAPASEDSKATKAPEANSQSADDERAATPPPPYTEKDHVPEVVDPSSLNKEESLDIDLRWTVLCDLFLVLISDSIYDARSRVLLETVGKALNIPWLDICRFEKRVTDALEIQEQAAREDWDEAEHVENRRKLALKKRYLMMGLATAGGGLLIGLSAGILAPVIGGGLAAGFTAIGVAGTSSFLAGAGGAAIITTSSAIAGGSIAIKASSRRMGAVRTFEYRPLHNNKRVNLILSISGWKNGQADDVRLPFSTVDPIMGDIYSLYYEPEMLESMGDTIRIIANEALTQGIQQVLASTFLTALMAGLSAPIILSKLSYLIDNPWSSSLDRAERAGLILADSIIDRHLGVRPITLVGFSLGARVIYSCLKELANRGAYGIVQNVYLFGSPIVANREEWLRMRTVISGRFVNGYASNDWILGYLFRATSGGIRRVAGLASVDDVPGLENFSCTDLVAGHMAYRAAMPRLLREVGWEVISDEFSEIEDPDPENHEARQRELIAEIEDARRAAKEQGPGKRRWWSNKKKSQKKGWEVYDQRNVETGVADAGKDSEKQERLSVLFDVEAIKRELASEHMEVKQLESTLPPMQLDLNAPKPADEADGKKEKAGGGFNPFASFRSKSYSAGEGRASTSKANDIKKEEDKDKRSKKDKAKEGAGMYDYDEEEDGEPTMTFERTPTPPLPAESEHHSLPAKSTTPYMAPEHNAWADEGEGDGEDGEVTMQFA